jgi:hypothetical protein
VTMKRKFSWGSETMRKKLKRNEAKWSTKRNGSCFASFRFEAKKYFMRNWRTLSRTVFTISWRKYPKISFIPGNIWESPKPFSQWHGGNIKKNSFIPIIYANLPNLFPQSCAAGAEKS